MTRRRSLSKSSGLVKRYGGLVAINDVDLALQPGTITGVIGPNGAGKSTLIGLIGGALPPTQGSIGSTAAILRACPLPSGRVRESDAPTRSRGRSST